MPSCEANCFPVEYIRRVARWIEISPGPWLWRQLSCSFIATEQSFLHQYYSQFRNPYRAVGLVSPSAHQTCSRHSNFILFLFYFFLFDLSTIYFPFAGELLKIWINWIIQYLFVSVRNIYRLYKNVCIFSKTNKTSRSAKTLL